MINRILVLVYFHLFVWADICYEAFLFFKHLINIKIRIKKLNIL